MKKEERRGGGGAVREDCEGRTESVGDVGKEGGVGM